MDYKYQYIDEPWNSQTVRVIRIANGKATFDGGFIVENDDAMASSTLITTQDEFYIKKLREQNEAHKRLAYFDVDGNDVYNSPGLEEFHTKYDSDDYDGRQWQSAVVKL